MRKVLLALMCMAAILAAGTSLKAQEVTITLNPGWTWISYLGTEPQSFSTALGSFTPEVGDLIKSQWGNAIYMGDGQWRGSITQFYPGYGYMYKSTRTVPVTLTLNVQQPVPQVVVTTLEPTGITTNSATCCGDVASSNGDYVSVTLRGICWSTNPNPTFNDNYIETGNGLGSFTVSLTELTIDTTYYVRAFAVTANGTFYGNEVSFIAGYVDLGLPSGTLWAICNVGANAPEEYGDYFVWDWSTYQYCNGSNNTLTKYFNSATCGYNGFTNNLTTLLPEDDAVTANWGNGWRMPTKEEWEELYTTTTVIWTTQNGVNGRLFIASNDNSLFLPAAGYHNADLEYLLGVGSDGYYWSSSLYTGNPFDAWSFRFHSGYYGMSCYYLDHGLSVRAVRSASQN